MAFEIRATAEGVRKMLAVYLGLGAAALARWVLDTGVHGMAFEIRMTREGSRKQLAVYLGMEPPASGYTARLFKAGFVPASMAQSSDYAAVEADFSGYAPQAIAGWADVGVFGVRRAALASLVSFSVSVSPSVGNSIGGYYVQNNDSGEVEWGQQLPGGPYDMSIPGATIKLRPVLTMRSEFA